MAKQARSRRAKLHVTNLRGRPARTEHNDEPSREDEQELNRLLALINGRGSMVDWESVVGKEGG